MKKTFLFLILVGIMVLVPSFVSAQTSQPYKIGFIYIYNDNPDTYNSNWKNDISSFFPKLKKSITDLSNNNLAPEINIIGEFRSNNFYWNPAIVGLERKTHYAKIENPGTATEHVLIDRFSTVKERLPGSSFRSTITQFPAESIKVYADQVTGKTIKEIETVSSEDLKLDCFQCKVEVVDKTLEYKNSFPATGFQKHIEYRISVDVKDKRFPSSTAYDLQLLESEARTKISTLNHDFDSYKKIFYVFGNFTWILPKDEVSLAYRCSNSEGVLGGYDNGVLGENYITKGGLIDCSAVGSTNKIYDKPGWHTPLHEILHNFGTCDVYETGTFFGVSTCRTEAEKIDSRINESVMGNDFKICMSDYSCTKEELDDIYLDKYNVGKLISLSPKVFSGLDPNSGFAIVFSNPTSTLSSLQSQLRVLEQQLVTLQTLQEQEQQVATTSIQVIVTTATPTVAFNSNTTSVFAGQSATLSWGAVDAVSCQGNWGSTALSTSGYYNVSPTVTTSYAITCTGAGGSTSKSVVVSVVTGLVTTATPVAGVPNITISTNISTSTSTVSNTNISTSTQSSSSVPVITITVPTVTAPTYIAVSTTPGKPDLTIYEFSLNLKSETYYKSQPFSLSYILKNIGQKESGQFKLSVKNRTNGWDLGGATFNSLAPSGVWDQTFSWSSLFWASEGYNLIELKVDGDGTVDESNENNNLTTFGIMVSAEMPPATTATSSQTTTTSTTSVSPTTITTSSSPATTTSTTPVTPTSSTNTTSASPSTATTTSSTTTTSSSSSSSSSTSSSSTTPNTTQTITVLPSRFSLATQSNVVAGTSQTISWQTTQGNPSTIRLSLYQNGGFKDFIAADTANTGSYSWTPSAGLIGGNYSIRIVDIIYPNDYADTGIFSITASSAMADTAALASIVDSARVIINQLAQEIRNLRK